MNMDDDIVGIVLAGGRSSRLTGLDLGAGGKAALDIGGEPCLGRVCRAVAAVVPRVIVVAAAGQPLPLLDGHVEIIRDTTPNAGPLAGIRDGLAHGMSRKPPPRWAFVASCDVPLLMPAVVRLLVNTARSSAARFVVPLVAGHPQVLAAVLACDLAASITALAAAGRGPRAVLDDLVVRQPEAVRFVTPEAIMAIDPELDSFLDLDTPADLARLESRGIPPSWP
jgi:molybdopterin-guanine dinucleotide biosynthesis protein A